MNRNVIKVFHYAKTGKNTWDSSYTELSKHIDFQSNYGIKNKSDVFQLQLFDPDEEISSLIDFEDRIDVFAGFGSSPFDIDPTDSGDWDDYFLFSGFVKEFEFAVGADGSKQVVLQGANLAERLLSTLWFGRYQSTGSINKVHLIIQNLLLQVNSNSFGAKINGGTSAEWVALGNPVAKEAGNVFPDIDYLVEYKPVYEMIEELSGDKFTGDGYYYYFLRPKSDGSFDFILRKRKSDIASGDITELSDTGSFKARKGVWDAYNYLIINAGQDPRGYDIQTFAYDSLSYGGIGMKAKYLQLTTASDLHNYEVGQNPDDFIEARFPDSSSYPYTTAWDSTSCADSSEYLTWFRNKARELAKAEGLAFIKEYRYPRWKVSCPALLGTKVYDIGSVYNLVSDRLGWTGNNKKRLRLSEVKYYLDGEGFKTDFSFVQDWEAITGVDLN